MGGAAAAYYQYVLLFYWISSVGKSWRACTGCGQKSSPLKFFAVFSTIAWNFNLEFYAFICGNLLHLTAKQNLILLENDEVIDFFHMTAYRFFGIQKFSC